MSSTARYYRLGRKFRTLPDLPPQEEPEPETPPPPRRPPQEEVHVIAVEVKTIGGTPLVNHPVRIIDPDTNEQIGPVRKTDRSGVVREIVPEEKNYRIEILEEDWAPAHVLDPEEPDAVLICHFVDGAGEPIANTKVEAHSDDDDFELVTDENGRIEAAAHLRPYELTIEDQKFNAHPLLLEDREKDENVYRFVIDKESSSETSDEGDLEHRLSHVTVPEDADEPAEDTIA